MQNSQDFPWYGLDMKGRKCNFPPCTILTWLLQWYSFGSLALMPEITKNCTRLLSWIKGEQKNWDSTPLMVLLEIGTIYFARSTWISVIYYYAKCHRIILRLSHLLTLMGVDHVRKTICMKFQFLSFSLFNSPHYKRL